MTATLTAATATVRTLHAELAALIGEQVRIERDHRGGRFAFTGRLTKVLDHPSLVAVEFDNDSRKGPDRRDYLGLRPADHPTVARL